MFVAHRSSLHLLRSATGRLLPQQQRQKRGASSSSSSSFWFDSTIDNTGSIARDILATERTFLAWARTGLGFVGAGSAMFATYHRQQQQQLNDDYDDDDDPPSSSLFTMNTHIFPACVCCWLENGAFPIAVCYSEIPPSDTTFTIGSISH